MKVLENIDLTHLFGQEAPEEQEVPAVAPETEVEAQEVPAEDKPEVATPEVEAQEAPEGDTPAVETPEVNAQEGDAEVAGEDEVAPTEAPTEGDEAVAPEAPLTEEA